MEDKPLVVDNKEESNASYSYFNFILLSLRVSSIYFIDSIPLTFTFYMLRNKGDLYLTSTLGLSLTYQAFSFSFLYGFGDAFGVLGSRLWGAKKYSEYTVLYFKSILLTAIGMLASQLFILWSPTILKALCIGDDLTSRVVWFLKWVMVERAIDIFNTMGRCVIVSQELSGVFIYINVACLTVFFVTSVTCFTYLQMGLGGYIIARYAKNITEAALQLYFLLKNAKPEMLFVPSRSEITTGLYSMISFYLYSGFGIYGEIMAVEATTQFAAYSGDLTQISAYVSFINIMYFFMFIGLGMFNTLRTHCNMEKGRGNIPKMMWIAQLYYKFNFLTTFALSIFIYTFAYQIARLFVKDEVAVANLVHLLRIYVFILPVDFNLSFSGTFLRTLDRANQVFYCTAIYFPVVMIISASVCTYGLGLGNNGLVGSYTVAVLSTYSIIVYLIYRVLKLPGTQLFEKSESAIESIELSLLDKDKSLA